MRYTLTFPDGSQLAGFKYSALGIYVKTFPESGIHSAQVNSLVYAPRALSAGHILLSRESDADEETLNSKPWVERTCQLCKGVALHKHGCRASEVDIAGPEPRFVGVGVAVMQGAHRAATARSKTMAKRIANALNRHKPTKEGV